MKAKDEEEKYNNSLVMLMENEYHSMASPLVSSGIFGGIIRLQDQLSNVAGLTKSLW